MMDALPNLAGIATAKLVDKIGTGKFTASYINWARTVQMLREHAPGWMPEIVPASDGGLIHLAPVGAYLLIRFRHLDGTATPPVPQAIMDTSNKAIPVERITARDVTDTQRRGVCMAAAFTFGLAYELWAKMPLESGYAAEDEDAPISWIEAIDGCASKEELDTLAAEIKAANLPKDVAVRVRTAYVAKLAQFREAA